ncbi:MAG: hypothetical protein U5L00_17845 [Desulfovermiculus sp.]|nr:hypothetical protein [Desulfovermiculus sp.]
MDIDFLIWGLGGWIIRLAMIFRFIGFMRKDNPSHLFYQSQIK